VQEVLRGPYLCIVLLGEIGVGKSTLGNLLIGEEVLSVGHEKTKGAYTTEATLVSGYFMGD
jgi:putative ribosome biogenesis GTPase RsgA